MRFTNIDVNEKVHLFSKTIKNIILNYIPHETITCDDRDLPWINKSIKELIQEKNQAFKSYRQHKINTFSLYQFELLQSKLNSLIEKPKLNYYARLSKILSDPMTSHRSYWSKLKTFSNKKKIPCIPPLLHDDKFITNFKEKAEIFSIFFAKQCFLINGPVEFLVHLEKIYIKACYIPLGRLESQDLENQQGQFSKVGQNILQTRI